MYDTARDAKRDAGRTCGANHLRAQLCLTSADRLRVCAIVTPMLGRSLRVVGERWMIYEVRQGWELTKAYSKASKGRVQMTTKQK